jgi:GTPase SAR1 family protein
MMTDNQLQDNMTDSPNPLDILQNYFNNATITECGLPVPSIKSHLNHLGCTNYYTGWQQLFEEEILNKLPTEYLKQKIVNTLEHVNASHLNYHQESYGWHALATGLICSHYATTTHGLSPKTAFILGFLHDFGKPFTETRSGKTFMHGQIGVHIAEPILSHLEEDVKQVLLFLIDQHMCVCSHESQDKSHICFSTLQNMISTYNEKQRKLYGGYYKCLIYGDRFGAYRPDIYTIQEKVDTIQSTTIQNILHSKVLYPHIGTGNFYLVMHGAPGCGKSTATKRFTDALLAQGITVGVAERDKAHWIVARKKKLIPLDLTFEEFVEKPLFVKEDGSNTTYYKHVHPIIKTEIAEHYKNIVLDYAEKYDIIIIDSCISLNPKVLNDFIGPQDTMYVWTGFPQHLLGRQGSLKVEEQSIYPLDQESAYYRSVIEISKESETKPTPLVTSSCFQELLNLIVASWRLKLTREPTVVGQDVYPSNYIQSNSLEDFKQQNPLILVDTSLKYYNHPKYVTTRLSYYDGKQNGNGTTLFYRGEHLISEKGKYKQTIKPLRLSLPVTPETSQLRKFHSHAELYHFVKPLQKYLAGEFTEPLYKPDPKTIKYNRCFILPKVDGSLMNVSVVKKNSIQGEYITHLVQQHDIKDFCKEIGDNVIYIGSKSCLFATQASSVIESFKDSIIKSYGSFDAFYEHINAYVYLIPWEESITVAFESVPEHPYWGLTVDYGRAFVSHLATIYYKDGKSNIKLPDEESAKYFKAAEKEELPCTAEAIEEYYVKKMDEALNGLVEDLEGFMLAFTDPSGNLLYMKLKFPWYYAAHKPDIHFREAERLYEDQKYAKIRDRLFNLQVAINASEIKKNPSIVLDDLSKMFVESFSKIYITGESRKDTMLRLFALDSLPMEDEMDEIFKSILSKLYMKMDFNPKKHMASLYDVLIADDKAAAIKTVTKFYIKQLKL